MDEVVQRIADVARDRGLTVALAESLTSGALASRLGAGPEASTCFRGGVVAYHESVKFDLLAVTPGPVVTERCAREMASGVADLLKADVALAVTGVGGPDPSEGKPAGTVVMGLWSGGDDAGCRTFHFDGDPEDVISATVDEALAVLAETLTAHHPGENGS